MVKSNVCLSSVSVSRSKNWKTALMRKPIRQNQTKIELGQIRKNDVEDSCKMPLIKSVIKINESATL
jgi:hypothetical protein